MLVDKSNILNHLLNNKKSRKKSTNNSYIRDLQDMIIKCVKGKYGIGNNSQFNKDFKNLFNDAVNLNTTDVPYSAIYNIVYRLYKTESVVDGLDVFYARCNNLVESYLRKETSNKVSSGYTVIVKTIENIKLSSMQMDAIYATYGHNGNTVDKISADITRLNKKVSIFESNVYGRFIAILGIFATLIASMFGGLSAIASAIKALSSKYANLFNILIITSLFALILIFVIFFSFVCISHLSHRSLNNYNYNKTKFKLKYYPVLLRSIWLFGGLFVIMFIFKYIKKIICFISFINII